MIEFIIPAAVIVAAAAHIRIVRPSERGVVERLGKFKRIAEPGLNIVIPFVDKMTRVNITEQIDDCESMEVITQDNLNAHVDVQIYYKVLPDESNLKKSQYAVADFRDQIINLARTTTRNVLGKLSFKQANNERSTINTELEKELRVHVAKWGIDLVRVELKQIVPPPNVQSAMNDVLVAEQKKTAAIDFALALETQADGERKATIKKAEGEAKAIQEIEHSLKSSKTYIEWLKVQRWNGILPQVTNGVPFMNIPMNKSRKEEPQ